MKLKTILFVILLTIISFECFSQKNVRDSLKEFTTSVVNQARVKGKVKKLAVWDFTNMNKEVFNFGSYIAELFSVYAELVDSVELMDRQNLKSLLNEHKLKSEGYIDKNTIMELGKFKDVDAVIVGSVIMADKDFQVVVKVIETSLGRTVSADEQFFPIDQKMAAILGIVFNESSGSNSPNRGYNRPLNSNEQYNNSSTVNNSCETNNTGDYCFYNNTKMPLDVRVFYLDEVGVKNSHAPRDIRFTLKPGESKCVYNIPAGISQSFFANYSESDNDGFHARTKAIDSGTFIVEKCKSKTYSIK